MKVSLIGMGGAGTELSPAAMQRLREAELVIGAARLLAALPSSGARTAEAVRADDIVEILSASGVSRAAVAFSGDTGFFSGAAGLMELLRETGYDTELLPGLSSVQTFAARLGRPWQDWKLCSAHGARCDVLAELKKGKPVFLLTGGAEDPARICRELTEAGLSGCPVAVGQTLCYPGETIRKGTARELSGERFEALNVMLIDPKPEVFPVLRAPGIPDDAFIRGDVPMTKQEVRAAILAKLGVRPTDVCWDIGAGTGSVSVELALAGKAVWAVERQAEACALIRENRERFRAWNLHITEGEAPAALKNLPDPDAVFVGGSGGEPEAILRAALERNPRVRLCVSAIALETLHLASDWMEKNGIEAEIAQIAVSRTRKASGLRLLMANNPVFLISGAGT